MKTTPPSEPGSAEAFTRRFLARVPPEVASSFSADQLAAVQRAFGMRYAAEHLIDMRRSIRLPWGRFYLVLLAGRDRPAETRGHLGRALAVGAPMLAMVALILQTW